MKKINISPILWGLGTGGFILPIVSGRDFWKKMILKYNLKKGYTIKTNFLKTMTGFNDPWLRQNLAKISSRQRARVLVAYKFAEENNLLVAGSAHKSEGLLGLFVKYGVDDCADIMPIKNLYRSHILQLGEYMGIPEEILLRSPNPDIIPGVTDKYQGYVELDAGQVDLVLFGLEKGLEPDEISRQLVISEQLVMEIQEFVKLSSHTRNHAQAPLFEF